MSATAVRTLRMVSFGDLAGHIWGGLVDTGSGPAIVCGGTDGEHRGAPGTTSLITSGEDDAWRVTGDGVDLTVTPGEPGAESDESDVLCTVTGTISAGEASVAVSCPGTRSVAPGDEPLGSLRSVTGWFGAELAISLHARRAPQAAGNQADRVRATLFGVEGVRPVDEPRLSTTLSADDLPARTSLELWVGDADDLYPRRAAGEARGPAVQTSSPGLELAGVPLVCHASGLTGVGVYLLARFA